MASKGVSGGGSKRKPPARRSSSGLDPVGELKSRAQKPRTGVPPLLKKPDSRYVVKSGDNLTKIAKANGTTVAAILKINPRLRRNPNLIFRGTRVRLK